MMAAAEGPRGRRLSIAHLALLVPWVALVIDAWTPIRDNSFLWHIRAGTVQASQGAVLTDDPFSFTMAGEAWRTQSWMVELLYGWLEGLTGLGFVPVMILLVGGFTVLGIGLVAYRRSHSVPATTFVLVLAVLALISFLVPRPVLFSYLLMTLVLVAWDAPKRRWMLPFLFWIWAAVHASFVIGLAYIGLSLVMRKEWRQLPVVIVSGLATIATAHGIGVIGFLLDFGQSSDALRYLTEWRRPDLLEPVFLPFLGSLVFIVIGAFRNRIDPSHLWLVVPFTMLGLSSVRALPAAFLGLVPLLAFSLSGLQIGSKAGLRPRLAAIFAAVVLALPFLLTSQGGLSEERFPVEAIRNLNDSATFHDDVVGGYLIWAEWPERKVYVDDRAELYGDRLEEFVKVRDGEISWESVFERDGVEQVLARSNWGLTDDLLTSGWHVVFEAAPFTVLRR